jgi:type IV secretion system protein VirD4
MPLSTEDHQGLMDEVKASEVESAQIEMMAFAKVFEARQTLSSIRTVLNTCLQVFMDENVQRMLEAPTIDFTLLRKEQSILFIQIPERHADYFAPITATLISQLLDRLLDDDGLQVYMLYDEFAQIGRIPSIGQLLSTARKHKISIAAAIQSVNQFERVYGNDHKELKELFKTILVTGGLRESAEYVSNLLGTYEEKETKLNKPIMAPDEVRRLDRDEMLIICANKRPVTDTMLDIVGRKEE